MARMLGWLLLVSPVSALRLPSRAPLSRGAFMRGALAAGGSLLGLPVGADDDRPSSVPDKVIGEIPASGMVFRDIVKVSRFSDPKVSGVQLYVSDFQLPMTERLASGDMFSDPTSSAVTCVKTGPIKVDPSIDTSMQGEEVISQARSLLFKSVKVRRLYDEDTGSLIYVSFSDRLNKNDDDNKSRFKSALCVLKVDDK